MSPVTKDAVFKALEEEIGDKSQVVTYKWLGRQYGIPYDMSKRLLYEFMTLHSQKVSATYLLSGWTPPPSSQHIIRVVSASDVNRQKEALAEVTSLHVYALAAGKDSPADATALFNADAAQAEALFPLSSVLSRDGASQDSPPEPLSTLRSVQSVQEAATLSSLRCCAAEAAPLRPPRRPAAEVPAGVVGVKSEASKAESRAEPSPAAPEPKPVVKAEPKTKASAKSKVASMFGARGKIDAEAPKAQPAGKRTAAQRIADSSDEESDQEMEEVPSQPAEEAMEEVPAPTPSAAKGPAAKKSKRVAKTFINDAGEEVTEMVEDPTSVDEAATSAPPPKQAARALSPPKPAAASKGGGQRNIMSFFGKK